jgi:polar amino acid transport system ATP-binding protein
MTGHGGHQPGRDTVDEPGPDEHEHDGRTPVAESAVKLSLRGVRKAFDDTVVLDGIDLEVGRGDVITLIGASGSGKSTLLRCVNLLEQIDDGEILLDGVDIATPGLDPDPIRRHIGMVFQSFNLFPHMNVTDNVAIGPRKVLGTPKNTARADALEMLDRLGLAERADAYPDQLSGGQQQRVAIARALVSDPDLLVCDEPTGDLDRETSESVLQLLQELNREHGKTIIMVTHDPRAAEYASRQRHMDKGDLVDAPVGAAA